MTTYTTLSRLAIMTPGDPAVKGSWGTILNSAIPLTEQLSAGVVSIDLTGVAAHTLTTANNAPDEARMAFLIFTGAPSGTATITVPGIARIGWVANQSTRALILTTGSGTTLTVPTATSFLYRCDATNISAVTVGAPGALTPAGTITLPNNVAYRGTDTGGTARNLVLLDASNNTIHGNGGGGTWAVQNQAATQNMLAITNAGAATVLASLTAPTLTSTGLTTANSLSVTAAAAVGTTLSIGSSATIGTTLTVSGSTSLAASSYSGTAAHGAAAVTGSNFSISGGAITNTPISGSTVGGTTATFTAVNSTAGAFSGGVTMASLGVSGTATIGTVAASTVNAANSSLGNATANQVSAAVFVINNASSFLAKDTGGTARAMFQLDASNNATFLTGTSGVWRVLDNVFTNQLFSIDNVGNAVHKGTLSASTTTIGGGGLTITGSTATSATGWQMSAGGTGAFSGALSAGIQAPGLAIQSALFIASSDARVKTQVRKITQAEGRRFIREVPGRVYRKYGVWEAGFFAQDIAMAGFTEILALSDDPDMPKEQNGARGPVGKRWELIQSAPQAYLAAALASLMDEVDDLRAEVAALRGH